MFSNVTQTYNLTDATFEISFMLAVAFLLGYLLAWLLGGKKSSKSVTYSSTAKEIDNLKVIEGIGPKIESLLNEGGISSFADIVRADIKGIQKILDKAGPKYQMHNPKTWPDQAELAGSGRWSELKEYQDLLSGGKDS